MAPRIPDKLKKEYDKLKKIESNKRYRMRMKMMNGDSLPKLTKRPRPRKCIRLVVMFVLTSLSYLSVFIVQDVEVLRQDEEMGSEDWSTKRRRGRKPRKFIHRSFYRCLKVYNLCSLFLLQQRD
jgi:hypothetical protein